MEIFHQINSRRILYVLGEVLGVFIEGDLTCFWGRSGCVLLKEILHVFGVVLAVFLGWFVGDPLKLLLDGKLSFNIYLIQGDIRGAGLLKTKSFKTFKKQECIPVGCVPAERWPYSSGEPPPENFEGTPPKTRPPPKKRPPPENLEDPPPKKTPPRKIRAKSGAPPPRKLEQNLEHPHPLWTEFMTHACENITLAKTSFRPVKNLEDNTLVGALTTSFWTSVADCAGFQSQGTQIASRACFIAWTWWIPQIYFWVIPADFLVANMAGQSLFPLTSLKHSLVW